MSAPPLSFETTQARRWTIAHPRLRLKPAHRSAGFVHGGWWPLTDQLYIELRLLLAALSSRSATIERVIYDENSWASASLRMECRGHSVILEPSNTSPNTPARSRRNRRPSPATTSRSGSTTTAR